MVINQAECARDASIDMDTYYPSFDDSSTMYKGNVIKQWGSYQKLKGSNTTIGGNWVDEDYPPSE